MMKTSFVFLLGAWAGVFIGYFLAALMFVARDNSPTAKDD